LLGTRGLRINWLIVGIDRPSLLSSRSTDRQSNRKRRKTPAVGSLRSARGRTSPAGNLVGSRFFRGVP
jgi:hypothetical protein